MCIPEIWGGLECTINRVGEVFRDQFSYSGHYDRPGDLERVAALGIRKLRYPVLWERHVGDPAEVERRWEWTGHQLHRILDLGMEPVVGFLHHGSGPLYTDLLDPDFPERLAAFATEVVNRFPFIRYITPVNEPLTTARFSGQYGWWYPHRKDQRSFVKMLLNQCRGVVQTMKAVRAINPSIQLVQTEDLGKTYSTEALRYQADFENMRRWFSLDLLCGKIVPDTEAYKYFQRLDVSEEELDFFWKNITNPDIIGFNYYITSERYIDQELEKYPHLVPGGNGKERYVDMEAVRADIQDETGLSVLLREASERYKRPLALTEVHMGCSREEQLRWFMEAWNTCVELNHQGLDIRAVTAWSLFGAFDWNSLLTREMLHYEPGVFDISSGKPRATALAGLIQSLATTNDYDHPLLRQPGWWKRPIRWHHPAKGVYREMMDTTIKPLLIIGRNGTLAKAFMRICEFRGIPTRCLSRQDIDILDRHMIIQLFQEINPWAVINCSGFVDVDLAELQEELCMKVNVEGAMNLAYACQQFSISYLTFSSDLVFSGKKKVPYTESDAVAPLNVYGRSKAIAEQQVLKVHPESLVIRSSAFFGPWDQYNFVYKIIQSAAAGQSVELPTDVFVSPTYVPDLVNASLDLLIDKANGIWHLANTGDISWADFAQEVVRFTPPGGLRLVRKKLEEMNWTALRPAYSVLQTEKGIRLPGLAQALERYFNEAEAV